MHSWQLHLTDYPSFPAQDRDEYRRQANGPSPVRRSDVCIPEHTLLHFVLRDRNIIFHTINALHKPSQALYLLIAFIRV